MLRFAGKPKKPLLALPSLHFLSRISQELQIYHKLGDLSSRLLLNEQPFERTWSSLSLIIAFKQPCLSAALYQARPLAHCGCIVEKAMLSAKVCYTQPKCLLGNKRPASAPLQVSWRYDVGIANQLDRIAETQPSLCELKLRMLRNC